MTGDCLVQISLACKIFNPDCRNVLLPSWEWANQKTARCFWGSSLATCFLVLPGLFCSSSSKANQAKSQTLLRHFRGREHFSVHKLPLIAQWSLAREIRDRPYLFLAWLPAFAFVHWGIDISAAEHSHSYSWSWGNHRFPWRNNCFHRKPPHADLLPNVIKAEKTSNIYNPNSPSQQTHWKILIQILAITIWRLFNRERNVSYNWSFLKTSFTEVQRKIYVRYIFLKRSLPFPNT